MCLAKLCEVTCLVKQFKSFRFDPDLYATFKALAQNNGLMVTEAFEKFMKTCVEGKALAFSVFAPKSAMEAEARVLLAWLRKGEYWYTLGNDENEYSTTGRLLQLLSVVEDSSLRAEIEEELKKR